MMDCRDRFSARASNEVRPCPNRLCPLFLCQILANTRYIKKQPRQASSPLILGVCIDSLHFASEEDGYGNTAKRAVQVDSQFLKQSIDVHAGFHCVNFCVKSEIYVGRG